MDGRARARDAGDPSATSHTNPLFNRDGSLKQAMAAPAYQYNHLQRDGGGSGGGSGGGAAGDGVRRDTVYDRAHHTRTGMADTQDYQYNHLQRGGDGGGGAQGDGQRRPTVYDRAHHTSTNTGGGAARPAKRDRYDRAHHASTGTGSTDTGYVAMYEARGGGAEYDSRPGPTDVGYVTALDDTGNAA